MKFDISSSKFSTNQLVPNSGRQVGNALTAKGLHIIYRFVMDDGGSMDLNEVYHPTTGEQLECWVRFIPPSAADDAPTGTGGPTSNSGAAVVEPVHT